MIYIKDGVPIIGVNSLHHPNRQRYTIAHELGHLELHRQLITSEVHVDKGFPVLMRDPKSATGTELHEIEANQFAAELLMPRTLIEQALAWEEIRHRRRGAYRRTCEKVPGEQAGIGV